MAKPSKPPIDLEMLQGLMTMARGGDRFAQNILNNIFKIDHIQQKSNFPTAINQQKQTYLKTAGEFYGDDPNFGDELRKPFDDISDWDAYTWQGYKGFLPNNYTEMLKKGTDLSGVLVPPQQPGTPEKSRFRDRFKKPKGEVLTE